MKAIFTLLFLLSCSFVVAQEIFFIDNYGKVYKEFSLVFYNYGGAKHKSFIGSIKDQKSLLELKNCDSIYFGSNGILLKKIPKDLFKESQKFITVDKADNLENIYLRPKKNIVFSPGSRNIKMCFRKIAYGTSGRLIRYPVDSLPFSTLQQVDLLVHKKCGKIRSNGTEITFIAFFGNNANEPLDNHVVKGKQKINITKRKDWVSIKLADLSNESEAQFLFVGFILENELVISMRKTDASIKTYWYSNDFTKTDDWVEPFHVKKNYFTMPYFRLHGY
ncbi:MAG: hypothetical protein WBA16_02865 [Nonlabens sp.]